MTIRIKKDRIEFTANGGTTYTLSETGDGFAFDGIIEGTNIFQNGFQGTRFGYSSGGYNPFRTTIDKFPFSADSNATDVGDLTQARNYGAGQSSTTHGYTSGGSAGPSVPPGPVNTIDRFPFATDTNATDIADLTIQRRAVSGQSSSVHGYSSGGAPSSPGPFFAAHANTIDKFPFTTNSNATTVGNLTQGRYGSGGQSSATNGYASAGSTSVPASDPVLVNTVNKFLFATDSNASDIGDLTRGTYAVTGQSSTTSGYTTGGSSQPGASNTIDKFPFASDTNATDVGDLSTIRGRGPAGQSSTISGYTSGGSSSPPVAVAGVVIDKFPFATDSNATDVGDLIEGRYGVSGHQD